MAASDPTGFRLLVFGPTDVLLICVICGLGCTSWNSSTTVIGRFFGALVDFFAAFLGRLVGLGLSCFFRFLCELIGLYQEEQTKIQCYSPIDL